MTHQRQPSRTSCGPTTVAMLADVPVVDVLDRVPGVRRSPRRARMRGHRTNVGELRQLLAGYGLQLGRRCRRRASTPRAVLRLSHVTGRGWHWAAVEGVTVYDPALRTAVHLASYHQMLQRPQDDVEVRLSWYPVEAGQ